VLIGGISDIHSNLAALEVVIDYMDRKNVELVINLGDTVGYYCKPNEVVGLLTEQHLVNLMGNHDMSIAGGIHEKYFSSEFLGTLTEGFIKADKNYDALESIAWHISHMTPSNANFIIDDSSRMIEIEGIKLSLAHGMPPEVRNNVRDAVGFYLYEDSLSLFQERILDHLEENECRLMMTGHTHFPYHKTIVRNDKMYHLINPGSVGQPRDGDPRASFMMMEINDGKLKRIDNIRLEYNVELTKELIKREDLPITLAKRLDKGK